MTSSTGSEWKYRALLIGIDRYSRNPLYGCVNDIDAIQRILVNELGVPKDRIRRLASPHEGDPHEDAIRADPATLANIRDAFAALAKDVEKGERVFIYYSGHGARLKLKHPGERAAHREVLVPADFDAVPGYSLLFDYELNDLLGKITARTSSVACILDCCNSAGATRGELLQGSGQRPGQRPGGPQGPTARFLELPGELPAPPGCPPPRGDAARGGDTTCGAGLAHTVEDCHVVAACMNHQLSWETTADGKRHGRFTRAFERAIRGVDKAELHTVPWSRIWQGMRAEVESQSPAQHLWMAGNLARAVFAGPPVDGDAGLSIRAAGDAYEIAAGTLASITKGALVAVYGEKPLELPLLGSPEDLAQRRGHLRVSDAKLSTAISHVEGPPFQLEGGERGRLVEPGEAAELRCGIVPWSDEIKAALAESPLLEVVREGAQVRIERVGDRWYLLDDLNDAPERALFVFSHADIHRARDVLDHYFSYALPLRLAQSISDMSTLTLRVLACPPDGVPAATAADPDLPEANTIGSSTYDLRPGDRVCFRVYNTSERQLRVTLLNSASSGKVQILGDQTIDGEASYVFWSTKGLGVPFRMTLPTDKSEGIDRLVAIGRTQVDKALDFLRVDRKFSETVGTVRGPADPAARDFDGEEDAKQVANVEHWTAAPVIVRVRPARTK